MSTRSTPPPIAEIAELCFFTIPGRGVSMYFFVVASQRFTVPLTAAELNVEAS